MPGLLDPISIRSLRLRNRLVFPPMGTRTSNTDGSVTEKQLEHYRVRAASGLGMIVVEHAYVSRQGQFRTTQLGVWDDSLLPGLRQLAEVIHEGGAAACLQLNHAGGKAFPEVIGRAALGPSAIAPPDTELAPEPFSREQLAEVVVEFAAAARRAQAAGFDAVEVHGAHGYLLSQFASPLTNQREDEYGGSLWGRFKLPLDVIGAVRDALPADYPILYRFGADDLMAGGLTPDEAVQVAPRLLRAGVDLLDVSGGLGGDGSLVYKQQGFFVPLAARVKQASGGLVVGIGAITEPDYADRVIREGQVDLVAVGRPILKDPHWATAALAQLAG